VVNANLERVSGRCRTQLNENGALLGFCYLILTAGHFLLPEIGDRQWSMPLRKGLHDAAECSSVENGACGLILLLNIDCWPIFCCQR
jgi:hypothetical protein